MSAEPNTMQEAFQLPGKRGEAIDEILRLTRENHDMLTKLTQETQTRWQLRQESIEKPLPKPRT